MEITDVLRPCQAAEASEREPTTSTSAEQPPAQLDQLPESVVAGTMGAVNGAPTAPERSVLRGIKSWAPQQRLARGTT